MLARQDFAAGPLRLHVGDRTGDGSGGPEIRVYGPTASGGAQRQLLRFDCFVVEPHYHFDPDGRDEKIDMDAEAAANPVAWSLRQLRERLPEMVRQAGGSEEAIAAAAAPPAQEAIAAVAGALGHV